MKAYVSWIVILAVALPFGCASREPVSLTPEDEAISIRYALRIMGVKSDVWVSDVDENGLLDLYIAYLGKKDLSEDDRTLLFARVIGMVAGGMEDPSFGKDSVYVEIREEVYKAYVEDCIVCMDYEGSEMVDCIDRIWVKVQ